MRLTFPHGQIPLSIWNTPNPPRADHCSAYPADATRCRALRAVEMDDIKGITFFFKFSCLCGIHVHHSEESCAMDTCARDFGDPKQNTLVWIYLPISKRDRVLALGTREAVQTGEQCILVRTSLVGDIAIGKHLKGNVRDHHLGASAPLTMLYGEPMPGGRVSFFGVHCRLSGNSAPLSPFRLQIPRPCPVLGDDTYFSWAPLSNVSSTVVFTDEIGDCKGILFRYHNGGARTVGQCRVQFDPAERVLQPTQVCFLNDEHPDSLTGISNYCRVKFWRAHPADAAANFEEGWESRQMKGIIKFWVCATAFMEKSSYLEVEN